MPPPPPPPPGPPPPPAAKHSGPPPKSSGKPPDRGALLSQIHGGARLKKVQTNDRSAPVVGNDCIEEGVTDLKRELKASKQDTECQLEELKKLKATAQEDVLKLKQDLHACRKATECLLEEMRELKAAAEKDVEELRRELQNSKQTTNCHLEELKELGAASTDNEKRAENTKRPLFKRFKDMFRSTRKKKKKHLKAKAVEKVPAEQDTAMNEVLFDVSLNDDYMPDETEGRSLRREGSTRSQISFGITFTGRRTSINSLPVGFSSGRFEDLDEIEENDFSRRTRAPRRIGSQRSLPEEIKEQDKDLEPIQITNHPASQEKKEGARVKLKCKAQGRKKVFYQWLKDGTKMRGQNRSTLALDSVELYDSGFYSCQVRYADSHGRGVTSYPAIVDIAPRDGMRYKYVKELDPYTQEKVETLLTKKSYGLGGWRQVAFKYDMEEFHIDHLEGNPEAGKATMTYLRATNPDLTVYEFCKTLKEHDMRRLDIVSVLLDHLTVADS